MQLIQQELNTISDISSDILSDIESDANIDDVINIEVSNDFHVGAVNPPIHYPFPEPYKFVGYLLMIITPEK